MLSSDSLNVEMLQEMAFSDLLKYVSRISKFGKE